jgi:hypothetical protein
VSPGSQPIDPGNSGALPTGDQYVSYSALNPNGTLSFRQVLTAVPAGKILTLPAGTFTIGADFRDQGSTFCLLMPTNVGGIVGSGPESTILQMAPNSSTRAAEVPTATGAVNTFNLMAVQHSNFQLKNLQVKGTPQGHYYAGVRFGTGGTLTGIVIDGCKFVNCGPGYANYPPGENMSVNLYRTDGAQMLNCEVDCRNPDTGLPESSSPIGINEATNTLIQDTYAHHAIAGMVTFWRCRGIHTVRLLSELNGSGSGDFSGAGINHEECDGTILHEAPTLLPAYGTTGTHGTRTGVHLGFYNSDGTHLQPTTITLTDVTHDAGPFSGMLYVYSNQGTPALVTKNGATLSATSSSSGNPSTQYFLQPG